MVKNWYFSQDNKRRGPVDEAALLHLIQQNAIIPSTLVWHAGLVDWVPLQQVRAELPAMASAPLVALTGGEVAAHALCIECRAVFPKSDLIEFKGVHVCAACKPVFLDKLNRGLPLGSGGLCRRGKQLVVPLSPDTVLPPRCVKCNCEAPGEPLKRRLTWHTPVLYLLIFFPGLLVYLVVAIIVRKRATLRVGLCARHRLRRKRFILAAWGLVVAGIGVIVAGANLLSGDSSVLTVLSGAGAILAGAIVVAVGPRVVFAQRITAGHVDVGGVGRAFLEGLPEWMGE